MSVRRDPVSQGRPLFFRQASYVIVTKPSENLGDLDASVTYSSVEIIQRGETVSRKKRIDGFLRKELLRHKTVTLDLVVELVLTAQDVLGSLFLLEPGVDLGSCRRCPYYVDPVLGRSLDPR